MAVYPNVISEVRSQAPLSLTLDSRTLVTRFEGEGEEKRRQKWTIRRRQIQLNYTFMTQEETRILRQFWQDRKGALEPFTFFYPNVDVYFHEFVGVAKGDEISLRLPARSLVPGEDYVLWRNGNMEPLDEYVLLDQAGPDGETIALLIVPAMAGDRFEFSFTGELGMRVRFEENSLGFEVMKAHGSWSVVLREIIRDTL